VLKVKKDSISAFGSLYKLPVIMEKRIAKVKKAVFSSDSFNHSVEMVVKDFINLEEAVVDTFGVKKKIKKPIPSKSARKTSRAGGKSPVSKKKKPVKKKIVKKKVSKKRVVKKK